MKTAVVLVGSLALIITLLVLWLWTPDKDLTALEARYLQAPARA